MQGWVKIQSFDRIHQAELRKDILEKNGIPSVIINEKDSLFLLGEIELYVKDFDEARAKELIEEFNGLTKINSFVGEKQMRRYREILSQNGIHAILKKKEDSKYIMDNFELYINNDELEKTIPYLKSENLEGWKIITICESVSQTKFRTDLLDEEGFDNFILKRKDSNLHLEKIEVYVQNRDFDKAKVLLDTLNGWIVIRQYSDMRFAEMDEDILNNNSIKAIIRKNLNQKVDLLVEAHNEEKAIDIVNTSKEWVILKTYESIEDAQTAKRILAKNDILSVVVNERDSLFLLGELELYVEIDNKNQAEAILKDF
ncbi:MAG: DUF2007 domain-containing protein [Bacteroidales bacterium]